MLWSLVPTSAPVGHRRDALAEHPSLHHGRLIRLGGAAVHTLWFWLVRSRQRRALAELDDHLLRDIGLTRDEARRESRHATQAYDRTAAVGAAAAVAVRAVDTPRRGPP